MTQTGRRPGGETDRPAAESARLFDVPGREDEAIRLLDGAMSRRHQVPHAEAALKGLTASERRAALEFGRQVPGGERA